MGSIAVTEAAPMTTATVMSGIRVLAISPRGGGVSNDGGMSSKMRAIRMTSTKQRTAPRRNGSA